MKGKRLTVEDLKNMDGEQVYVKCSDLNYGGLAIVNTEKEYIHKSDETCCLWSFRTIQTGRSVMGCSVAVYEWVKKSNQENKPFTKSDLKTGMWVECRDNWKAVVLLNTPYGDRLLGDDGEFARVSEYLDDLTDGDNYKEYDIMKIYSPKSITSIKNGINLNLIWQREEKPINTIEHEVIRTFTYNNETITLVHKDNWTTVRLKDGTMAKSRCHPEDQFDRDKGLELAYYRAKKKQFENAIDRMIKAGL